MIRSLRPILLWVLFAPGAFAAPAATVDTELALQTFDAVWNTVRRSFYDPELHGVDWDEAREVYRPRVEAADSDGEVRSIHRAVGAVSSFGGSPLRQEIGLGQAAKILTLTVTWPTSGEERTFRDVPLDAWIRIVEGSADFELLGIPSDH